jgi:hypothetical protein
MSLITPPRVCDDPEVQKFLDQHFLDFKTGLTAHGVLAATRKRFVDLNAIPFCFMSIDDADSHPA